VDVERQWSGGVQRGWRGLSPVEQITTGPRVGSKALRTSLDHTEEKALRTALAAAQTAEPKQFP